MREKSVYNKKLNSIFSVLLVVATCFMSIGYAAINSISLTLAGTINAKVTEEVFISYVEYSGSVNANETDSRINNYIETALDSTIVLSDTYGNSSITYKVTVSNGTSKDYVFIGTKYDPLFYDNTGITFTLSGLDIGYELLANSSKTFEITFHYVNNTVASENVLNSYLNFSFREEFSVSYNNITNNNYPDNAYDGEDFVVTFTNNIPTNINVYMGGNKLTLDTDYTYVDGILTVFNVDGDLVISENSNVITAVQEIIQLATDGDTDLIYDGTVDNNLRYYGSDPKNYVNFNCDPNDSTNCETWRIIGVMNNVMDENNISSSRIKLIRNDSIGRYVWGASSSNVNSGQGINDWNYSSLMSVLNDDTENIGGGLYWNRTSGQCYNGRNNTVGNCDFSTTGLYDETKIFIDKVIWNIGGPVTYQSKTDGLPSNFYTYETSRLVIDDPADGINRSGSWLGYVGLMAPSDYGYATKGGTKATRDSCLAKELYNWYSSSYSDCVNNDYLLLSSTNSTWTIIPYSYNEHYVMTIAKNGRVIRDYEYSTYEVNPVVYLDPNVMFLDGTGDINDPYILGLS